MEYDNNEKVAKFCQESKSNLEEGQGVMYL